jgi:hypothetical protein
MTLVIAVSFVVVEALAFGGVRALVGPSAAEPVDPVRLAPQADRYGVYDRVVAGSTGPLTAEQSRLIEDSREALAQPCWDVAIQP